MYCLTNDAPSFIVTSDGYPVCHRCRADLSVVSGREQHPDFRPLRPDYVADRENGHYKANMIALEAVQQLWKYAIHGDDAKGWVDLEFKDLVTAASFVQTLPGGVAEFAGLRPVAFFRGKPVVITFPVPDDHPLFG